MKKGIAIIPARGGSKRIPRKNIRNFLGNPIITYSVRCAIDSGLFDVVMVSTDDDEVAAIAVKAGAEVPFLRNRENASDFATTGDVISEVLATYREKLQKSFDFFCCLYPTAPLVSINDLQDALQLLRDGAATAVVPVVQYSHPVQRSLCIKDGKLEYNWPENASKRSQDLLPLYHDAGQFYMVKTVAFEKERSLFTVNTLPIIKTELDVQDIDNEADWKIAELKYRIKNR